MPSPDLVDCFLYNKRYTSDSPTSTSTTYTSSSPQNLIRDCVHARSCDFLSCDVTNNDNASCEAWSGTLPGGDVLEEVELSWVFNVTCQLVNMSESKQHCLKRGYRLKGGSSREIHYSTSLSDCYKACSLHAGDSKCLVFKYRWTTGTCDIYFSFNGVTSDKDGTYITARLSCLDDNSTDEPCLKRSYIYTGNILQQIKIPHYYKYRAIGKCLNRCRDFKGQCQYLSLDVVDFECKLYAPGTALKPDIFSYSASLACLSGLRCPDTVVSPSTVAEISCYKLSVNLVNPAWYVDGVPINSSDYRFELSETEDKIVMRLFRQYNSERKVG
ncbi:hypothetical protein ACHWQZ_G007897 [Mnemiopsis leidyi]